MNGCKSHRVYLTQTTEVKLKVLTNTLTLDFEWFVFLEHGNEFFIFCQAVAYGVDAILQICRKNLLMNEKPKQ